MVCLNHQWAQEVDRGCRGVGRGMGLRAGEVAEAWNRKVMGGGLGRRGHVCVVRTWWR